MEESKRNVADIVFAFRDQAENAKRSRMDKNEINYQIYNLEQDFSYKQPGQSREFLAKMSQEVEQLTSFLQQGLMDQDKWFSVQYPKHKKPERSFFQPEVQESVMNYYLDKAEFPIFLADSLKSGFLGSLMIGKVGGKFCEYITDVNIERMENGEEIPVIEKNNYWELDLGIVRQENYFPDPTGRGLYEIERIEIDKHSLIEKAKRYPEIYHIDEIMKLSPGIEGFQEYKKSKETNQDIENSNTRNAVEVWEFWGDLVEQGTAEVIMKNCYVLIGNNREILAGPIANPNWHKESPYVVSPILRVPNSVWHRALCDAPAKHNKALNEIYNLMVDSGMMSVFGIKQLRAGWLKDPKQVSDGIAPGKTLLIKETVPAGAKVLERVDTGNDLQAGKEIFNITSRMQDLSSFTNDMQLGAMPQRQVKATEIISVNEAINSVFAGIVVLIEKNYVVKALKKSWLTIVQNMNRANLNEMEGVVGSEIVEIIRNRGRAYIYKETAINRSYKVFGLSGTMKKIEDFRKISTLLQVLGQVDVLAQEFQRKYSFSALIGEVLKSLDIDVTKIEATEEELQRKEVERQQTLAAVAQGQEMKKPSNQGSQIPQMASQGNDLPENQARRIANTFAQR